MQDLNFTKSKKITPVRLVLNTPKRPEKSCFFDENRYDGDVIGGGPIDPKMFWGNATKSSEENSK